MYAASAGASSAYTLGDALSGEFGGDGVDVSAGDHGLDRPSRFFADLLRCGDGFKGDAIQLAFPLFSNDENGNSPRALLFHSNF